jgi:hypothetical protein
MDTLLIFTHLPQSTISNYIKGWSASITEDLDYIPYKINGNDVIFSSSLCEWEIVLNVDKKERESEKESSKESSKENESDEYIHNVSIACNFMNFINDHKITKILLMEYSHFKNSNISKALTIIKKSLGHKINIEIIVYCAGSMIKYKDFLIKSEQMKKKGNLISVQKLPRVEGIFCTHPKFQYIYRYKFK